MESVQVVVGDKTSSMEWVGHDLDRGPDSRRDMAVSPNDPFAKQTSRPNC
jgi:hypothetical protein